MNLLAKISQFFERKDLALTNKSAFYRFFSNTNWNRTYSGQTLESLYRSNELAFACINKIADVMNDAELIVERLTKQGEWEKIPGHALANLIKKPNSEEIGLDLRRKMVQSENVAGLVYIRLIRPRPMAVPNEIYILNPNRVLPWINYSQNRIEYFIYTNQLGYQVHIAPEDILIRRRADLTDEFYGLSPLSVAANTIDGDENLTDYVNSFLDGADGGGGVPSGILKFQRTLSPEMAEQRRKLWNKNTKANEVQVLDDNAEYQPLGSKLNEIASDSIRAQNDARICGVFGVPAILVSAYVGYLHTTQNATAKSALKDFWLNKISPELKSFREWATWFLLPLFEDIDLIKQEKIRVGWDLSQMLALAEDVDLIQDRARKNLAAGGWTLNEFREATGKVLDKGGDYYLQPLRWDAVSPENRAATAIQKVEQGTNPNDEEPKGNQKRLQLKAAATHEFSSTQIDVPTAEKKILLEFGKSFISDEDLAEDGREDKPHITVKYGLHTNDAEDLKTLLAPLAPFEVTLKKTSIFAGKGEIDYDVVKIDVESAELRAINKLIADNLEVTDTHPKYVPHLTIAYVQKGKGANYIDDSTFAGQKIYFDKITFSDKNRNKTVIKLTGEKSEKKTFDFDGLTLSREPNEIEKLIGLKSLVSDLENQSENLQTALLKYRDALINQAVIAAKDLDAQTIHALTLERNAKLSKLILKSLSESYEIGRAQIIREINLQKSFQEFVKNIPESIPIENKDFDSDESEERISEISDSVLAKILNEIQSRTITVYVALKLLGIDLAEFYEELKKRLLGESAKFIEQLSKNSANIAIQTGRSDEIEANSDGAETEYSAILDKNCCEYCKPYDGKRSKTPVKDLPRVPNQKCSGGASCRCFWVVILD